MCIDGGRGDGIANNPIGSSSFSSLPLREDASTRTGKRKRGSTETDSDSDSDSDDLDTD